MSDVSKCRFRMRALAAATAIAMSSMVAVPALAGERINLGGLQASELHDRFIVKYRDGSPELAGRGALEASLKGAARAVPARGGALGITQVRRMTMGADVVKTDRKLDRVEAESLMRQLAANPNVEYVEVDKLNKLFLTPNDPNFGQQYGFGTGAGGIRATEAWDVTSGSGTVVAVLDTGITNHPDLNANILPGYDFIVDTFVSRDGNGRDSDPSDPGDWIAANECGGLHAAQPSSWHGTHVTGTVAAVTNNNVGVAGTAFNAKVVPVRVLGRCGGYDSDIADAVIWASGGSVSGVPANANPAEAINLSLGGGGSCGSTMQSAINGAVGRGTTVVIAAGNSNANVSGFSPANCNNVVAVASNTSTGARSGFSNYGALIDVSAPGSSIMSTLNSGSTTPGSASYASYNGTSMAAPHVAGVVALMQSVANPALTPAQVESTLKSTARAFPSTPSQPIGAGIVNAKAAVDAAGGGGPDPDPDGELENGVPVSGISGGSGSTQYWTIEVPAGATNLSIAIAGGSGDADLYVRRGSQPTTSTYDCRPYRNGNNETCTFATPQAGTYHIMLRGYSAYSGVTLTGSYSGGGGGGNQLQNGVPVTGISGASGSTRFWIVDVPAGRSSLNIAISGGSGDADLYVRRGSQPTTSAYDCRPYRTGNNESCAFSNPQAGTWHVMLRGYSAYSGVSLVGNF
ncbi:S8 family serine peptidase [Luteimonas sp. SJ-92]|uniref:S8 family serine peptidase n=1 Tax=Luteimonas salinisoli TaxID=2752307 RepID=A0A853JDI1_9GAMM|nr:S8 family serine peptidase [Luteimonas salinisoli]